MYCKNHHLCCLAVLILPLFVFVWSLDLDASEDKADPVYPQKIIVLDPGHGGNDPGAVGSGGLAEKAVTLEIARRIKEKLIDNYDVFLTRNDDYHIRIPDRISIANHLKADLYISIHTAASFLQQTNGMVIFYYNDSNTRSPSPPHPLSSKLNAIENQQVAWDEIQNRHTVLSKKFAEIIEQQIKNYGNAKQITIESASLVPLKGADMPAVLIEFGHITNPSEEISFNDSETLSDYAEIIRRSVEIFFHGNSKLPPE